MTVDLPVRLSLEIATRTTKLLVPGKDHALFVGRKTGLVYFARTAGKGVSEQWVIFRSNMHGQAHVYMAEVAKAGGGS